MEEEIAILVQHDGKWDSEHNYNNFIVDGMTLKVSSNLDTILDEMTKILGVYASTDTIEIKYSVKQNYTPMKIYNDRSLRWYLDLKRKSSFTDFPLCITLKEKNCDGILSFSNPISSSSNSTHDMQLVERVELTQTLISINNNYSRDEMEIDEDGIINNRVHKDIKKGQLYMNKEILQDVLNRIAIKENFQFKVKRSSTTRYYLVCVDDQCSWYFKSSSLNNSNIFKVRKFYNVHTYGNESRFFSQRHATSKFVGGLLTRNVDNPKTIYTPADIQRDIRNQYGVDLNYMKAWRAKEKALEILRGKPRDSYGKLPSYLYMVKHTNPGSVTRLEKTDDGHFLYAYVALYASIKGWEYCMPIVVVDGSFLKAAYRGTILTAWTQDAAGKILPLAFAVVDSENDVSWKWFFERIRETYGIREGMCIVSDRHESILNATSEVYPGVPHCVCLYHLWGNIKKNFRKHHKVLRKIFFAMANAYTTEEFDHYMAETYSIDNRVKEYLFEIGYHRWSVAHSNVNRFMVMTSNIAESVNAADKEARDLLIYDLLDYLMKMIGRWNNTNRNEAIATGTTLSTKYENLMREKMKESQGMMVVPSTEYLHTVYDGGKRHVVNMRERICTCRQFQMDVMLCKHALAIVRKYYMSEYEYCSVYYKKDNLLNTYEVPVYPISDESIWKIPPNVAVNIVLPPKGKIKPGRPQKIRYKNGGESRTKKSRITCGVCGQQGHNRQTCRNIPQTA
ncbi:uncharacterized protein LOC125809976 [Solanum verrucosum]|nr:uncharacterized protein LOC125809976 [Solanum verrucosum]